MMKSDEAASNAAKRALSRIRRGRSGFRKRVPDRTADAAAGRIGNPAESARIGIPLVDEDGNIVRPTLTMVVDAYSRAILGFRMTPG